MFDLKNIKLFVLDMDGTYYLGDKLIDGAPEFLEIVERKGKEFMFFTNNSSKTPADYIAKLAKMNTSITEKQIMTSGDVTIEYLKSFYSEKKVFLLGTPTLKNDFVNQGIELTDGYDADVVVIAFDMSLTYENLEKACTNIRNGAVYLATHLDVNCPTEDGFIPDCGAMCSMISHSTGKEPKFLGKPFKETIDMIMRRSGYAREEIAIVGDRLYTDVATGVKNGSNGILVLTGETKLEDVEKSEVVPTKIYDSLYAMSKEL